MLDSGREESDIAAMRRLMLLRHAKTERAAPGERDRDRKLTKRGRADAGTIGAYMARHGLVPDLALVSPATRAQETWNLMVPCFAKAPKVMSEERIYNATAEKLMSLVAETRDARTLLMAATIRACMTLRYSSSPRAIWKRANGSAKICRPRGSW